MLLLDMLGVVPLRSSKKPSAQRGKHKILILLA